MRFVAFILIGFLAGWLSGLLIKGEGYGCIGNILIGIVGGLIGGVVFDLLGLREIAGFFGSLLTALVGALLLVFVVRLLSKMLS